MTEPKTIESFKKVMLLSLTILFGSFSLVEYYDILPEVQIEKEQSSEQDESDDQYVAFSVYEAIVPVFNSNVLQTLVLVFTLDLAFELDLLFNFEVPDYQSEYQRLLFSRVIAPNAP